MSVDALHGLHVDAVDVGALLTVDLDGDEEFVHFAGDGVVLERFALHDVAPVAGGVADGDEDGLILGRGAGEGLRPPRQPVHGVMGVLEQVGRRFVDELVRHGSSRRKPPRSALVSHERAIMRTSDHLQLERITGHVHEQDVPAA